MAPNLTYGLGCPPCQDSSHLQDCYVFRLGDPNLNLHECHRHPGRGGQPNLWARNDTFFIILYKQDDSFKMLVGFKPFVSGRAGRKVAGVLLALLGGSFTGVQSMGSPGR